LAETIRILVAADQIGRAHYPTTLFRASETEPGRCTARSTVYTANIAAGLMVHQFARWLRGQPVDSDVTLNLLSSELVVGNVAS
jgi:sulfur carrier protein ThiS adenylyltransferase